MEKSKFFIILLTLINLSISDTNIVQEEAIHLTVKIYQDIPKHLCGAALANLEVIIICIIGKSGVFIFIKL